MPRFSETGADMYICQVCGRDLDSEKHPPEWRTDITMRTSAANVCPSCVQAHEQKISAEIAKLPQEQVAYLNLSGFKLDRSETSADGSVISFKHSAGWIEHPVKAFFRSQGYTNQDGRVYMRHTGNPHVNLERTPQDYCVQISWGRFKPTSVSFLRPVVLSTTKQST